LTLFTTVPDMPETNGVYCWNADDYAQHSSAQASWAGELLDKLALSGEEAVLDIGCGDGRITAAIAERLPAGRAVGIDNSDDMIARAEAVRKASGLANLSFSLIDALEMDFAGVFDVAFSNASLHWIHDHVRLLSNVHRALKPYGGVLFQMGGKGNAAGIAEIVQGVCSRETWIGFYRDFAFPYFFPDEAEYRSLLDAAGFAAERVGLIPKDMVQRGKEGLAGWLRTTWMPYTHRLPENMREGFVSAVVDGYVAKHGIDPDGGVHVRMVRLEVEAGKREVCL
jgi:trans-aconitate methyltransferase